MDKSLIEKKTLHPGTKQIEFKDGAKVHFHFKTCLCNAERTVLDDSRKMGAGTPMELVLGKKFRLEVWEAIVQKMALNEVAAFTVDKSLVLQYPFVSKKLREVADPCQSRRSHCCAMTIQTEGVGYDDLTEFLKNPSDLEFTIELLKVEQADDYQKDVWQMSETEKLRLIPELKQQGNASYKLKNYADASDHYSKAIGIIEQLMIKEKPHDDEWEQLNKMKMPILLNFAQCKLSQRDFYPVIEHCTTVIQTEPGNIKAYFRRAKAHVGAWNPTEALQDFEKVIELDQSLEGTTRKEITALEQLIKQKNAQDKDKLKNMFR